MHTKRIVRLFRNGRNQAIRIPRDFELPASAALLAFASRAANEVRPFVARCPALS